MTSTLLECRRKAALASGGHSSDAIYRMAINEIIATGVYGTYLDLGGGTGQFSGILRDIGLAANIVIADLLDMKRIPKGATSYVQCDLNRHLPFADNSFDCVVALEVIEHLENPRHFMREVYRILRNGGAAFVSTPNCENLRSYISLLVRGCHWAFGPNSYPSHITALLRIDLIRCAQEAQLKPEGFVYSNEGRIPGFPHISWQTISAGLLRGRLFSDNVLLKARKG